MQINFKQLVEERKVASILSFLKQVGCDKETTETLELLVNCLRGRGVEVNDILNAFVDFMDLYKGGDNND